MNNLSYAIIFNNLFDELPQKWNISGAVKKFYNKRVGETSKVSHKNIKFDSKDESMYFYALRKIIGADPEFDWSPENVGNFFINQLLDTFRKSIRAEDAVSMSNLFDSAFIMPEMNISILNFAHLHTMNDFKQLLVSEDIANKLSLGDNDVDVKNYLANFPSSFYKCFNEEKSYFQQITLETDSDEGYEEGYMLKSPCIEKRHLNNCAEYCQWVKDSKWSNFFTEKEFMSLMQYALPQAKIPNEQDETEYKMAAKILGKESLKKTPKVTPVPLVILCKYQKFKGWEGQDIGMNAKFCDSFVQVPTDVGICVSGPINSNGEDWNVRKIRGGTHSSMATFFLDTDAGKGSQTLSRSLDRSLDEIQMQIHPRTEMAQILHELNQDHSLRSYTLKRGHEYTFEVSIDGRIVTENFLMLPIGKRKCKLSGEVDKNSWFNDYSKRQCKYKCRAILAFDVCGCIPWEFFRVGSYPECDVFGRTCFKNAMENITLTDAVCEDCFDDCQYLRYRYKMTNVVTDTITQDFWGDNENAYVQISDGECSGLQAICHYLQDKNHTLHDKYSPKRDSDEDLQKKFEGMIIVNIVFPTSEADLTVLDVRYTLIDKITSLGGSFGLFTQFTGCSIIAVIHLVILTIKQICIFFKDLKSKFCPRN